MSSNSSLLRRTTAPVALDRRDDFEPLDRYVIIPVNSHMAHCLSSSARRPPSDGCVGPAPTNSAPTDVFHQEIGRACTAIPAQWREPSRVARPRNRENIYKPAGTPSEHTWQTFMRVRDGSRLAADCRHAESWKFNLDQRTLYPRSASPARTPSADRRDAQSSRTSKPTGHEQQHHNHHIAIQRDAPQNDCRVS